MSDHYGRWLNHKERCVTRLRDEYKACRTYGGTAEELSAKYHEIVKSLPKGKPVWLTSFLNGYREALDHENWSEHLVYAYYIGGRFLTIDSDEYKALDTDALCNLDISQGAHVWREHPQRVYHGHVSLRLKLQPRPCGRAWS